MSQISLDADLGSKLSGCKVGKAEEILVTIVPTKINDDGSIEADITGADYDEAESGGDQGEGETPPEPAPAPAGKKKRPAPVERALAME